MKQFRFLVLLLAVSVAYAAEEKVQSEVTYQVLASDDSAAAAPAVTVDRAQAIQDKKKVITGIENSMKRDKNAPIDMLYVLKVPQKYIVQLKELMESYNNQRGARKIPGDSIRLKQLLNKLKNDDSIVEESENAGLTAHMQESDVQKSEARQQKIKTRRMQRKHNPYARKRMHQPDVAQ